MSSIPSKCTKMIASVIVRNIGQCCLSDEFLDKRKGQYDNQQYNLKIYQYLILHIYIMIFFFYIKQAGPNFFFFSFSKSPLSR